MVNLYFIDTLSSFKLNIIHFTLLHNIILIFLFNCIFLYFVFI